MVGSWPRTPFYGLLDEAAAPVIDDRAVLAARRGAASIPIAWKDDRDDRGRRFSMNLGEYVGNLGIEEYRKLLIGAIHWAARQPIDPTSVDAWISPEKLRRRRPLVRAWSVADFHRRSNEAEEARSFASGKQLFVEATCATCHRIRNYGGIAGPDLTTLGQRLQTETAPALALLTSVLKPSETIHKDYTTRQFLLNTGKTVSGIVVNEDDSVVRVVANPATPDVITEIPVEDIDAESVSNISLMPEGLLNAFEREEILDLLTYIKTGGDPAHPRYQGQN